MNPHILHCPKCKETQQRSSYLGSISSEGYLIIKRKQNYMMIMAQEYSIICDCGYFIRVHEGRIVADATSVTPS